jgi:hypothetical protein
MAAPPTLDRVTERTPAAAPTAAPGAAAAPQVGRWEVLAVGCELALLASLAVAGWQGADPLVGKVGLAVALPGLAIATWGMWMAPASRYRLRDPWRALVQAALFLLTGAALAAVGHPWWGLAVAAISILDVAVLSVRGRRR